MVEKRVRIYSLEAATRKSRGVLYGSDRLTSTSPDPVVPSAYRAEVDGLRALAVVAVIANHADRAILPSGYLGVDIFFVISGYVITSSLMSSVNGSLGDFLSGFYVRRIKRLAPALIFFVVLTSLLLCLFNLAPNDILRTGITAIFGVSNLRLFSASTDYFAESPDLNAFMHTWSLGVEEQFYLFFPVLLWSVVHFSAANRAARNLIVTIGAISIASLLGYVALSKSYPSAAYFLMPARLWELGAGCLTFLLERQPLPLMQRIRKCPPFLPFALLLATLFMPQTFIVSATIAAVVFTSLLIATLTPGTRTYRVFTRDFVVTIGLMSYSLYLWHWGVLAISRLTIGVTWITIPIQIAIMFALAYVSYRYLEKPLRHASWGNRRWQAFAWATATSVPATILLALLIGPLNGKMFLGRFVDVPIPAHLQKTWWKDLRTGEYLETCHAQSAFSDDLLQKCLAIPPGKKGKIYLLGDSFARNYMPAIKGAFPNYAVAYMTMGLGCSFLPPAMAAPYSYVRCADYAPRASKYVMDNIRPGDLVFVGQHLDDFRITTEYMEFLKSFARQLGEKNIPMVLLDGTVPPRLSPQECLPYPWIFSERSGCQISLDTVAGKFSRFDDLANAAAKNMPSFFYAPLRTGICNGNVCGQETAKGTPVWHDEIGHITEKAAAELSPLLQTELDKGGLYAKYPLTRDE